MSGQKYIFCADDAGVLSFLLDEYAKPLEIRRSTLQDEPQPGDIYVGRVSRVAWNIQAAFVNIDEGRDCYLPLEQLHEPVYIKKGASERIQQGDELLVQVTRAALKTKAAALSSDLSLRGRFLILGSAGRGIGVSRKLPEDKRKELKKLAMALGGAQADLVLRTNAAQASEEEIRAEYMQLQAQKDRILSKAQHVICPARILGGGAEWLRRLLDLSEAETDQIITDEPLLYEQASAFLAEHHPELSGRLVLHGDTWPLRKKYDLDKYLREALSRRVWLRSGAYLLIESMETLTAVDVNTGSIGPGRLKNHAQETFRKINLEAAAEIARQLRLRGISGMILIDFISMESEEDNRELMQALASYVERDPVKTRVIDMTKLGLVEVTRQKTEKPLTAD